MEKNVKLTIDDIYNRRFEKDVKGYNPDEVDAFLDQIIQDYGAYEKFIADKDKTIRDLDQRINASNGDSNGLLNQLASAKERIKDLEIEMASLNNKYGGLKPGEEVNSDNLELIQKIHRYEDFIHGLGYNPKTLEKMK